MRGDWLEDLTWPDADPTLASADKGRAVLAARIADLVDGLRKLDPALS